MNHLIALYNRLSHGLDDLSPQALPLLARATFAAVLLGYFWASGLTKFGPGLGGLFTPSDGAFVQIFPREAEAFGYDISQFTVLHRGIVLAGSWAEMVLPLLIVLGLFTRLAALGMIGFVLVQSLTDIWGHGVGGDDLGAWFDRASGSLILDQRALWVFVLLVLVLRGAGALSLDAILARRFAGAAQVS